MLAKSLMLLDIANSLMHLLCRAVIHSGIKLSYLTMLSLCINNTAADLRVVLCSRQVSACIAVVATLLQGLSTKMRYSCSFSLNKSPGVEMCLDCD